MDKYYVSIKKMFAYETFIDAETEEEAKEMAMDELDIQDFSAMSHYETKVDAHIVK